MTSPVMSVPWVPRLGELVALLADGQFCVLRGAARYEVADGDLVITSKKGRVYSFPPDAWAAIGTYEEHEGLGYIALEAFGEMVPERPRGAA